MALRYTPLYDENGNVIAPEFFLEGASVYAGEINSGIDRDNMPPNTIASGDISSGDVFTTVADLSVNTNDNWSADSSSTTWQGPNGNGTAGLGYRAFTLAQPAHIQVFWSGMWTWNGSWSRSSTVAGRPDHEDTYDTIRIRATIDGVEVFVLGPFEDAMVGGSAFGTGSIQVQAGPHVLLMQVECVRRTVQTGLTDGPCVNTVTFDDRALTGIARYR